MKRRFSARPLTLSAMVLALTVLFLYASEVVPYCRLACMVLASLFVYVLVAEHLQLYAWLTYLAAALLSFLLLPSRVSWFFYVVLIGHYGIVRELFVKNVNMAWLRSLLLLLYANVGLALGGYLLSLFAGIDLLTLLPDWPIVLLVAVVELCLFLLDFVYNAFTGYYLRHVRRFLVRGE